MTLRTSPAEMERVFGDAYRTNRWKGTESRSGPGSSLGSTAALRRQLPTVLKQLDIRSLLDAPCGDLNWMKELDPPLEQYIGVDVLPDLIADLSRRYAGRRRRFQAADISSAVLPRADLILCRDCLVHLSFLDCRAVMANFRKSGAEYLLVTTFPAWPGNQDARTGGWRPLNLREDPFRFPEPIGLLHERDCNPAVPYSDKSLGLWRITSLPEGEIGKKPPHSDG